MSLFAREKRKRILTMVKKLLERNDIELDSRIKELKVFTDAKCIVMTENMMEVYE